MKSKTIKIAGLLLVLSAFLAPALQAVDMEGEEEWASGTVQKVQGQTLSLLEYDYETESEKTVSYALTEDTDFGSQGRAGLKQGVYIDVSYLIKNGKNLVTSIIYSDESDSYPEEESDGMHSE